MNKSVLLREHHHNQILKHTLFDQIIEFDFFVRQPDKLFRILQSKFDQQTLRHLIPQVEKLKNLLLLVQIDILNKSFETVESADFIITINLLGV